MDSVIVAKGLEKKYKKFTLGPVEFEIPKGFSTALVGANGAGKTTLLDVICGIIEATNGGVTYFDGIKDVEENETKERIGYLAAQGMYPLNWTPKDVAMANKLGFQKFSEEKFWELCKQYGVAAYGEKKETLATLSDGNRIRLCLAAVFARETELLVLDEPGSNLDPLMRDRLCGQFREYLEEGNGEKTILFSTHNIADMENVTDYCVIMEQGRVVEQGFVEELKEKYVIVKGELGDAEKAEPHLIGFQKNTYGYEGLCLAENLDKLAGLDIVAEMPTLSQISVAIMKQHSVLKG